MPKVRPSVATFGRAFFKKIKIMQDIQSLRMIVGNQTGGQLITGTAAVNGSWFAIVVNTDAVITELHVNGVNVTSARGLTGGILVGGMYLSAGTNSGSGVQVPNVITRIQLASGSVIAY